MDILLTQVGSMGDCLLTTTIARQIKEIDYPGCHLTWVIGDCYREVLENNPYVDETITLPVGNDFAAMLKARRDIRKFVAELIEKGRSFDKIFILDLDEKNSSYFWGTCRAIYFRIYQEEYRHRLVVPPDPVICLTEAEIQNVRSFCKKNALDAPGAYPILIEHSPRSRQSPMNRERALALAKGLVAKYPHVICILSAKEPIDIETDRLIDGSTLTYRENAELLNHCKLLIGANSGITWLNASTWSRKIPMIQDVMQDFSGTPTSLSFSVEMDYRNASLLTDNLIELRSEDFDTLFGCACDVVATSFASVKAKYAEIAIPPSEYMYRCYAIIHSLDVSQSSAFALPLTGIGTPSTVYLFNILPLLTFRKKRNQLRIKLFGLPFLKIKTS